MICYKDDEEIISQIEGHHDVLDDLLTKPAISFEPDFDDDHIPTDDFIYKKLFYQIDVMLLYNPDRDIIFSALKIFDQFCDSQFPISIFSISIYQQIIKIGTERIHDFQIVSTVLSIFLYICSSAEKKFIINLKLIPFLYKIINFFNEIQLKKLNNLEKQIYDDSLDTIANNYIDNFNKTVFFLTCLGKFYEKNDCELKEIIPVLLNIILTNLANNQNTNEVNQTINYAIDFSRIFDCLYIMIANLRFNEDEMIQINHFFIEFLEKTNLIFFNSSFLKAVCKTKSWQFNIFNIFNNEIFINYMKNCFSFINQNISNETVKQDKYKYQNLANLMKYSFKALLKIDLNFPEIFDINFEALNGPFIEYYINDYFKCVEKNLKTEIIPINILSFFHFSFGCFLNCEFKTQKSSIGLISQLSNICVDKIYQNIIECIESFISFIETGNVEITKYILIIFLNVINFCSINDQNSFNTLLDELIDLNVLQIIFDSLNDIDQYDVELTEFTRCLDEHIQNYQQQ